MEKIKLGRTFFSRLLYILSDAQIVIPMMIARPTTPPITIPIIGPMSGSVSLEREKKKQGFMLMPSNSPPENHAAWEICNQHTKSLQMRFFNVILVLQVEITKIVIICYIEFVHDNNKQIIVC